MTKNTALFIASFLISMPLWLGLNLGISNLENFFYLQEMARYPSALAAQALPNDYHTKIRLQKPIKKEAAADLLLQSRSALSLYVNGQENTKILYAKDLNEPLPVASLAKLMSALVVLEQYPLEQEVVVSKTAVAKEENFGNFRAGEKIRVEGLFGSMLLESSNDAAVALAEFIGEDLFLHLMNKKASDLSLEDSSFVDVAGVDPDRENDPSNLMSAKDLAHLAMFLLKEHPQVFELLSLKERELLRADGSLHHVMKNTNGLLEDSDFPLSILGGKTGWTPLSKGCLLLITEAPHQTGYLVNVVLGSEDRFVDMETLVDWIVQSYDF